MPLFTGSKAGSKGSIERSSWTSQLMWQDGLHQPKRQWEKHYPLCFSSKHLSNNQAGHHSQFAKQGETLDPTAQFFVQHSWRQPVQKQQGRAAADGLLCYRSLCTTHWTRAKAGLWGWRDEILKKTVPHIHHVLQKMLHKAGDMSLFQLRKPEQPSAEELSIREEIHWFRLFTHTRKEKYLFWCLYYCSD